MFFWNVDADGSELALGLLIVHLVGALCALCP